MARYGHEIANHSWNHYCNSHADWCLGLSKGKGWYAADFPLEIDSSTNEIARHTGVRPRSFAFPFDQYLPETRTYLEEQGYIATRSGAFNQINLPDAEIPARMAFELAWPEGDPQQSRFQKFTLNAFADEAVRGGGWAVRGLHGVQDGSWGSTPLTKWQQHLDYIAKLRREGKLFIGTTAEVTRYMALRSEVRARAEQSTQGTRLVWAKPALDSAIWAGPRVTLEIDELQGAIGTAQQDGQPLPILRRKGLTYLDIDPWGGPVELK